jgi:hypothetical protein
MFQIGGRYDLCKKNGQLKAIQRFLPGPLTDEIKWLLHRDAGKCRAAR